MAKLQMRRECTTSVLWPPLNVVTIRVACGDVRDMTPDPMSIHRRSLGLISFVFGFGPGCPLWVSAGWPFARRRVRQMFLQTTLTPVCPSTPTLSLPMSLTPYAHVYVYLYVYVYVHVHVYMPGCV